MARRPIVIIVVSVLFAAIGVGSLVAALLPLIGAQSGALTSHDLLDSLYVTITGVLALVSGIFMFRGKSWARWLCVLWMAGHVVLSIWHPWSQLIVHSVMLIVLIYVLFLSRATTYFRAP
jgi:hypothetical protein